MTDHVAGLEALLPQVEGKPLAMVLLARQFAMVDCKATALDLCRRACALAPTDAEVHAAAAAVISADVPSWHFNLVRDRARNDAYETALGRAVRADSKVLEIGTGTGILAMMAARAGAAQVMTCEAEPAIADAAREVIAHNGYAGRIRVITKYSTALDREADLGGPADILVSEIFSNNLLGENVLDAVEHALQNLMKSGATVIPRAGCIRVALAHFAAADNKRMGTASGFDLTPFNLLAHPCYQVQVGNRHLSLRSEPADLFRFDFNSPRRHEAGRNAVVLTVQDCPVNGIVQWIALDMDGEGVYENRPAFGRKSAWAAIFHPLSHAIEGAIGHNITVSGSHDRHSLRLWATLSESSCAVSERPCR